MEKTLSNYSRKEIELLAKTKEGKLKAIKDDLKAHKKLIESIPLDVQEVYEKIRSFDETKKEQVWEQMRREAEDFEQFCKIMNIFEGIAIYERIIKIESETGELRKVKLPKRWI